MWITRLLTASNLWSESCIDLLYPYLHIYNSNNTVLKMLKHICVKGIDGNGKILVKPKLLSTRFLRLLARKKKKFYVMLTRPRGIVSCWSTHISYSSADFLLLFFSKRDFLLLFSNPFFEKNSVGPLLTSYTVSWLLPPS